MEIAKKLGLYVLENYTHAAALCIRESPLEKINRRAFCQKKAYRTYFAITSVTTMCSEKAL